MEPPLIASWQRVLPRLQFAFPILACVVLSACAGNGEGLDSSGRPLSEGGSGSLNATFDSIQANVFTPICTACHIGATAPHGLRLDAANSYSLLVGIASAEVPALQRVRPGDPDNSYLIQKLEGSAAVGGRMPLGGPALPAETVAYVRQWIRDGALRTTSAGSGSNDRMAVVTSAPAEGDALPKAPAQLVVSFTRELDATRVDAGTVQLLSERADGTLEPIDADIHVRATNPYALVVTPRSTLPAGSYVLRLGSGAGNALMSVNGTTLQPGSGDSVSFVVEEAP